MSVSCHLSYLPKSDKSSVQLVRHGNLIYKFKILPSDFLKKLLQCHNEHKIQMHVESIMEYILRKYGSDFPKRSVIRTNRLQVFVSVQKWLVSNLMVFHNKDREFLAGGVQFVLLVTAGSNGSNQKVFDSTSSMSPKMVQTGQKESSDFSTQTDLSTDSELYYVKLRSTSPHQSMRSYPMKKGIVDFDKPREKKGGALVWINVLAFTSLFVLVLSANITYWLEMKDWITSLL